MFTHFGTVTKGAVTLGDTVNAKIDVKRRNAIKRNHTAAHLLQAGLRSVLGTHSEQAGQLVNENTVRFDFTHFSGMTSEEIEKVENFVNNAILDGIEVLNKEMPIEEAKKMGAMALFGEKYGDVVRVVAAKDTSIELCGGTHVDNTSKLGLFHIISEASVAAGVRRIEAVTGFNVIKELKKDKNLLAETSGILKAQNSADLAKRANAVMTELKETQKALEIAESKLADSKLSDLLKNSVVVNDIRVAAVRIDNTSPDELRKMSDTAKAENDDLVIVLAAQNGDKITFCAACGKTAISKGAHAGNLVREIAKIAGGNGGGKPDSAMAGGKDAAKIDDAISSASEIIKTQLK